MNNLLIGGIAVTGLIAAFIFFRYYLETRDRFFVYFSLAFLLEGLNRIPKAFTADPREDHPAFYLVRLVSYGLILFAIWQKNRSRK